MSFSFSTGLSGMKAAQVGMDVTSHNIANVNTPNFRRHLVNFAEVTYKREMPNQPSGAGVKIASITQAGSPFLIKGYSDALSNSSEYDTLSGLAKPLDALLDNPSLNLATAMQDTFNAFQDVANNPTSIPVRQNAIDKAQSLSDKSGNLMKDLETLKGDMQNNLNGYMDSANSLLNNIAELNKQIVGTGGNEASPLVTQRDNLALDLSKLTGITYSADKSTITTTSGKVLLSGNETVHPLSEKDLPKITGGAIGGTNKFITGMLNPAMEKLPQVISETATKINEQAVQGFDLNGKPGSPIFNTSANGISVAINDPKTLGAATTATGANDGTNAQKISDLKNKLFDGQTLQGKYSGLASSIDSRAKNYSDMSKTYSGISDDYASRLNNEAGVNLDEEAANLLKYQRMYEANAKVIKTQDEMFGTLINIKA